MAGYEEKFTELQKYIPFMENMIARLENSKTGDSNPRGAQLEKIKALRNLLIEKNKKMKMENLLKCEQVLTNLYSKVGESDSITHSKNTTPQHEIANTVNSSRTDSVDLQSVREKLKIVTNVAEKTSANKSPMISPAVRIEVINPQIVLDAPLFERRPKKSPKSRSLSPKIISSRSLEKIAQRKYTRVLQSPEPKPDRWRSPDKRSSSRKSFNETENQLFHRRSPRKSPGRSPRWRRSRSFSPHRRKKSLKKNRPKELLGDDVNITLNVPEESLSSLNTSNLMDRIVNCNKDDVDIDQLRQIRAKIVKELKQTGANQDISDYILKSYRKEERKKKKKAKKEVEVEDGELTDSESETRDKVYGNLTIEVKNDVKDSEVVGTIQDTLLNHLKATKPALEKASRRNSPKIKISLIISNEDSDGTKTPESKQKKADLSTPTTSFLTDVAVFDGHTVKDASSGLNDSLSTNNESSPKSDDRSSKNHRLSDNIECPSKIKHIISKAEQNCSDNKTDTNETTKQPPFFYGELMQTDVGDDKLSSPQISICEKIEKEKADVKSPYSKPKGENSTKHTKSVVDSTKRPLDATPKNTDKKDKKSTEVISSVFKPAMPKNKDKLDSSTSKSYKDSKNEESKHESPKTHKELSEQTSHIISKYISNVIDTTLTTSPLYKVDNIPETSKNMSSSRSNLTIKQIASSIEAVSKPKSSKHANIPHDKLSELLYKDLSPSNSPSPSPKRTSTSNVDKDSTDANKSTVKDEKKEKQSKHNKNKETKSSDNKISLNSMNISTAKTVRGKEDNHVDSENIPFLSESPKKPEVSEIDILKALKNDILDLNIPESSTETPSLHQPKISKVTDNSQLEADKKRRISLEKYKEKTAPGIIKHSKPSENKEQAKLLSKVLTAKEYERFQSILKTTLDTDDMSDDESNINMPLTPDSPDLVGSQDQTDNDMGPKSPEDESYDASPRDSPILIPSDPVKKSDVSIVNLSKSDVDMRVFNTPKGTATSNASPLLTSPLPYALPNSPKVSSLIPGLDSKALEDHFNKEDLGPLHRDFPVSVNYKGRNPKPLLGYPKEPLLGRAPNVRSYDITGSMTPSRAPSMTQSRAPSMTPSRAPSMTPSRAPPMTPSRTPNMTPSMTPSYSPADDNFPSRRHVYATIDLGVPWDDRDDGSSTPVHAWDRDTRSGSVLRDPSRANFWDNSDARNSPAMRDDLSDVGSCTPRYDPFNRNVENYSANRNNELCRLGDPRYVESDANIANRGKVARTDPRLDRKDDYYQRDYQDVRTPNYFMSDPRKRNVSDYDRTYTRETSVGPMSSQDISFTQSRPIEPDSSANHTFPREVSVVRPFAREQSVGRTLPVDERRFTTERSVGPAVELRVDPRHVRGQSVGRTFDRQLSEGGYTVRESSVGRATILNQCHSNSNREPSLGRTFQREGSVGRNVTYDFIESRRDFARASSVGRSIVNDPNTNNNRIRVWDREPTRSSCQDINVGRTFTRESSVGRHMARATSVGRNITQESIVGRNTSRDYDRHTDTNRCSENKHDRSKDSYHLERRGRSPRPREGRSRSVGRHNESTQSIEKKTKNPDKPRKFNYRDPRTRREDREKAEGYKESANITSLNKSLTKCLSSPKNSSPKRSKFDLVRDPRLKCKDPIGDDRTTDIKDDRTQSGINYTSDNIAKGQIRGSGSGVGNYKIPKIKRPVEEPPVEKIQSADIINQIDVILGEDYVEKTSNTTKPITSNKKDSQKTLNTTGNNKRSTRDKKTKNIMTPIVVKTKDNVTELGSPENTIDDTAFNEKAGIVVSEHNSTDSSEFDELLSNIRRTLVEARSDSEDSTIESNISKDTRHIMKIKESNNFQENHNRHEIKVQRGFIDVVSEVEVTNEIAAPDNTKIITDAITADLNVISINNTDVLEFSKSGAKCEERINLKNNIQPNDKSIDLFNTVKQFALADNIPATAEVKGVAFNMSKKSESSYQQTCHETLNHSEPEHVDTSISEPKVMKDRIDKTISDITSLTNYEKPQPSVILLSEERVCNEIEGNDSLTDINTKSKSIGIPEELISTIEKSNITSMRLDNNILSTTAPVPEKMVSPAKKVEKNIISPVIDMNTMVEMLTNTAELDKSNAKASINLNAGSSLLVSELKKNEATSDHMNSENIEETCITNLKTVDKTKPKNIYDFVDEILPDETLKTMREIKKPDTIDEISTDRLGIGSQDLVTSCAPAEGKDEKLDVIEENEKIVESEVNKKSSSIPDSTMIDTVEETTQDHVLPDSTEETEINDEVPVDKTEASAVSSSQDLEKEKGENTLEPSTSTDASVLNSLQSLDSIISILKNPTKMKEIFSLLSGSSVNKEVKKFAAKLFELHSDEEIMSETVIPAAASEKVSNETAERTLNETIESKPASKESDKPVNIPETAAIQEKDAKEQSVEPQTTETDSTSERYLVQAENSQFQKIARVFRKNPKNLKYGRGKRGNKRLARKMKVPTFKNPESDKRVTRSEAQKPKTKKTRNRELQSLQENLRDMFDSEEVLTASATGIRNCRLAKLIDEKPSEPSNEHDETKLKEPIKVKESTPVVVLPKIPLIASVLPSSELPPKIKKKPGPKPKKPMEVASDEYQECKSIEGKRPLRSKQGSKSKFILTKANVEGKLSEANQLQSSDDESLSSLMSTSSERLTEPKTRAKRKSSSWNFGYIKSKKNKNKNKKEPLKNPAQDIPSQVPVKKSPDYSCFIDKSYCFYKSAQKYQCRLCGFEGLNIVQHYKQHHPHVEVPLSRINPKSSQKAIEQSLTTDFGKVNKNSKPRQKIICRFCFQVFQGPRSVLEKFFWHVVSTHTGEYKHSCSVCPTSDKCPTSLDIPSPPEEAQVLLLGFICGECHYTQISLNNLKTHVALRHNNDETEVYSINLCDIPPKNVQKSTECALMDADEKSHDEEGTRRKLRSKTTVDSNVTLTSTTSNIDSNKSADHSKTIASPSVSPRKRTLRRNRPKFTFEADEESNDESVKSEIEDTNVPDAEHQLDVIPDQPAPDKSMESAVQSKPGIMHDVEIKQEPHGFTNTTTELETSVVYDKDPHFMIATPKDGAKSYLCKIKTCKTIYRTALLVALKKHVQLKHKEDIWDGYCSFCDSKLSGIENTYSQSLGHLLEYHMDEFPVVEEAIINETLETAPATSGAPDADLSNRTYINVRPLADLLTKQTENPSTSNKQPDALPQIESVVSLQNPSQNVSEPSTIVSSKPMTPDLPSPAPISTPMTSLSPSPSINTEADAIPRNPKTSIALVKPIIALNTILAEKHGPVRDAMLAPTKLVQIFKCAGRYCSYTGSDDESFKIHIQSHLNCHNRDNSDVVRCAYCDYASENNALDLVSHVVKEHGHCRFSCRYCFYVATSAAMVWNHRTCEHPLQTTVAPLNVYPKRTDEEALTRGVLTRSESVLQYKCTFLVLPPGSSAMEKCKYRGYTSAKFIEHIALKHRHETSLPCRYCKATFTQQSHFFGHLRQHGLCLYQCTFCLYGVDTEAGMLQHVTHYHPNRRPQAYLRHIIENKETGVGPRNAKLKFKVLPLVHVDRINVQSEDAPETSQIDSPEVEAERARELEKILKNDDETPTAKQILPPDAFSVSQDNQSESSVLDEITNDFSEPQPAPVEASTGHNISEDSLTVPPLIRTQEEISLGSLLIVPKTELLNKPQNSPKEPKTKSSDNIICLDSDDEDRSEPQIVRNDVKIDKGGDVIALSDDEAPAAAEPSENLAETAATNVDDKQLRLHLHELFKCQKCETICKNQYYYRTHFRQCYDDLDSRAKCPFCPLIAGFNEMRVHLIESHGPLKTYICGVCKVEKKPNSKLIIKHMLTAHGVKDLVEELESNDQYDMRYVLIPNKPKTRPGPKPGAKPGPKPGLKPGPKPGLKRKLLQAMANTPSKVPKRYGPEDLERLPINPILDEAVVCARCEYGTKVRSNMLRHLQMHANEIAVPSAAPVNPVPHLESNEMHFDKMTNLAASSNVTQRPERMARSEPVLGPSISPETAAKYPKYVPDKERNACGAIGCSYISVDEAMLKYHWETLHSGATSYRCVHCPATQQLDTTRPLTASRIVGHLKMHDVRLYACRDCGYYHFQVHMVDRHAAEKHGPSAKGHLVLREPSDFTVPVATVIPAETRTAPTMDLKPWQCGLCAFKSMLRPEVSEHCLKIHNLKFQFKCSFCPLSGSVQTTVNRHQTEMHPGREERDFIHVYYKERSLRSDEESSPLWKKQRLWFASLNEVVKSEVGETTPPLTSVVMDVSPAKTSSSDNSSTTLVNLNLVKSEVADPEETLEELTVKYGSFGQPKGELYACPLCKVTMEATRQAMMTHLHEELNYRKWACNMCTYKAFSKIRMMEHSFHEHKQTQEPQELTPNRGVEIWVQNLLDHQEATIDVNRLARETEPPTSTMEPQSSSEERQSEELERMFGTFGTAYGQSYACPRCDFKSKEEAKMHEHLEMEMAKVRWSCSRCSIKFQNYHEAERHCTELHLDTAGRVTPVTKDPKLRSSWIAGVLRGQKLSMSYTPVRPSNSESVAHERGPSDAFDFETAGDDSSLLVVRYEEDVQPLMSPRKQQPGRKRKPTCLREDDSDDENGRLVIVEPPKYQTVVDAPASSSTANPPLHQCPHCRFATKWLQCIQDHIIRHYNLKPYMCGLCPYGSDVGCERPVVRKHFKTEHPDKPLKYQRVKIPDGPVVKHDVKLSKKIDLPKPEKAVKAPPQVQDELSYMCLLCDTPLTSTESRIHHSVMHSGAIGPPQIVKKGTIVLKCWSCQSVHMDIDLMRNHHKASHPGVDIYYTKVKLGSQPKDVTVCAHCNKSFKYIADYKCHHNATHANLLMKYEKKAEASRPCPIEDDEFVIVDDDIDEEHTVAFKRKCEDVHNSSVAKRLAKKSTTKLPYAMKAYARKSTTRLPYTIDLPSSHDDADFSFYGTKPRSLEEFADVTTRMPFYGKIMTLTVKKLSDFINITPVVAVEDLKNVKC